MISKITKNKQFSFLASFVLSNIVFFNLSPMLIKFWELPAREMLLVFLLCVPLLTLLFYWVNKKLFYLVNEIPVKRIIVLGITAMMLGIFFALAFPHIFTSTVILTPKLIGNERIDLMEVKLNGHVIPVSDLAEGYGWDVINSSSVAALKNSRPMQIKTSSPVNKPVSLLFASSPESGEVKVTYWGSSKEILLKSEDFGETAYSFKIRYRNFPPWLFIIFLTGIDIFAYGIYAFILFLIQEKGQILIANDTNRHVLKDHRVGLLILALLSVALHLLNILTVPLIMDVDSPSFLRGAFHLVRYGNFDGVSMFRGPGTTLLFAPIAAIFGRNPWGMKIFLHLMAVGCVFLNYRLAWQLSNKRWIAFMTGLVTLLIPDLYFFSNYVMSDLPNIFFASLFSTFLISAMRTYKKRWIYATFFTASFAILLRSENLVLLAIGIIALGLPPLWEILMPMIKKLPKNTNKVPAHRLGIIAFATLLGVVPVFLWSAHNLNKFGFFGMSNYAGEVFYTGWIYYAEASGYPFADQESWAVQEINAAIKEYPIERLNSSGVPTGWNVYPSLVKAGYSSSQSFGLLSDAAKDSIQSNWRMAWDVLWVKLRDGLTPATTHMVTFSLPGEPEIIREIEPQFFDAEALRIPLLIKIQRVLYTVILSWYEHLYQYWIWLGLLAAYFSLQRKPTLVWGALAAIMLTRIFIPDIMGKSDWRYTIAGIVIMQALAVNWLSAIGYGVKAGLKKEKSD